MLNSQDALLGPWLPGRDMLEDELRTFVGECRAECSRSYGLAPAVWWLIRSKLSSRPFLI